MNNMGSTTLLHPVFNNLEQVIIFRRVDDSAKTSTNEIKLVLYSAVFGKFGQFWDSIFVNPNSPHRRNEREADRTVRAMHSCGKRAS